MEIVNELRENKRRSVDDFLSFIPIYEDRIRERKLKELLKENQKFIKNKVCVEAGAGIGIFSEYMLKLGAKRVYAVEESKSLFKILKNRIKDKGIVPINKRIEDFEPDEEIDFLFHEFYGNLLLDESIPALEKLKFRPRVLAPDEGILWCMKLSEKEILKNDEIYEPIWKEILRGVLVSNLFPWVKFRPWKKILRWKYGESSKNVYEIEIKGKVDFLCFACEIKHRGKSVLKTWLAKNWSPVFTPKSGNKFILKFVYKSAYTDVIFKWID